MTNDIIYQTLPNVIAVTAGKSNLAFHVGGNTQTLLRRKKTLSKYNLSIDNLITMQQTHSTILVKVDCANKETNYQDAVFGDALYTFERGLVLGVLTADCLPILFYSAADCLAGVIHAGWKGSVSKITQSVINTILTKHSINPTNLHFIFGPCLMAEHLLIKEDVVLLVEQSGQGTSVIKQQGQYRLDLVKMNQEQLLALGINQNQITYSNHSTHDKQFYSYRRNKKCGRHLSFICLK